MPNEELDPAIHQFISAHIQSVAQLEILLLLHTNPAQAWTPAAIARELRIEASGALQQLTGLASSGLVKRDPPESDNYFFAPASEDLARGTHALAQAYLVRRVTVIGLIFAKPVDKIRVFSDAFRIRQDPPRKDPNAG
ncbi:MAG: hypothetical protein ACTHN5_09070 [Phycisphaerae bacterium]